MPAPHRPNILKTTVLTTFTLLIILLITAITESPAFAQERQVILNCSTGNHVYKSGRFDCANATGGRTAYTIATSPSTLNPVMTADSASSNIHDHIFGTHENSYSLLATGPGGLIPKAASSVEINDAGNEITYKLRPNLRYSDGSAVDALDVLYWYYDVILNPELPNPMKQAFVCPSSGQPFEVVSPDSDTIIVRCPAPFAEFTKIAGDLPVMSRQMALDLIDDQNIPTDAGRIDDRATRDFLGLDTDISLIRGLGPFTLVELDPRALALYERNEFFYEYDSSGTRLPYLDELEIIIEPGKGLQAAFSNFTSGRTDIMIPRLQDVGTIVGQSATGGYSVNRDMNNGSAAGGLSFLTLNYDDVNPGLAQVARNPNVRHALSLAIDRINLILSIYYGYGTPQYVPISLRRSIAESYFLGRDNTCSTFSSLNLSCDTNKNILSARGVQSQADLLPPPGITDELDDHLSCLSGMMGCLNQANAILDSEGLRDTDGDGIRNLPNGNNWRIEVTTNTGGVIREFMTEIVCQGWEDLGIDCSTNAIPFAQVVAQLLGVGGARWSGALIIGLTEGDPTQSASVFRCGEALYFWHLSCDPSATSGPNARVPSLVDVEEAYNAGLNANSFWASQENFDEFQRVWSVNEPIIMLAVNNSLFAVRTDRLCNDGRELTANDNIKFRVDVAGNAGSCMTNQGR